MHSISDVDSFCRRLPVFGQPMCATREKSSLKKLLHATQIIHLVPLFPLTWNKLIFDPFGSFWNISSLATSAIVNVFNRNVGQNDAFNRKPNGGCNMPPLFSIVPTGLISFESTKRQKSFLLSLPSRRIFSRGPSTPTTVAMHVDVILRGSSASSFMPILKLFFGGSAACLKQFAGAATPFAS